MTNIFEKGFANDSAIFLKWRFLHQLSKVVETALNCDPVKIFLKWGETSRRVTVGAPRSFSNPKWAPAFSVSLFLVPCSLLGPFLCPGMEPSLSPWGRGWAWPHTETTSSISATSSKLRHSAEQGAGMSAALSLPHMFKCPWVGRFLSLSFTFSTENIESWIIRGLQTFYNSPDNKHFRFCRDPLDMVSFVTTQIWHYSVKTETICKEVGSTMFQCNFIHKRRLDLPHGPIVCCH